MPEIERESEGWRRQKAAERVRPSWQERAGQVVLDPEGSVLGFDAALAEALGYAPGALVGSFFFAYVHARDLAPMLKDAASLLHGERDAAFWTFRFRTATGAWHRLAAVISIAPTPGGLVLQFEHRRQEA